MTEKLGVLMIDVPVPSYWKYHCLEYSCGKYDIFKADNKETVKSQAYKCTQEEAKEYPQFRWVALEEL